MRRTSKASPQDLEAIERLLSASDLPGGDVGEHLADFLVRMDGSEFVGCVGCVGCVALGRRASVALLRSLAVAHRYRGRGESVVLVQAAQRHARRCGVGELYLLTTTPRGLFARLGYRTVERSAARAAIQATAGFSRLRPAHAVCMRRALDRDA